MFPVSLYDLLVEVAQLENIDSVTIELALQYVFYITNARKRNVSSAGSNGTAPLQGL